MRPRLSAATLEMLPAAIRRPAYDRSRIESGIVHLGPGAFHRVHQAWYAQRWLECDPRWGITGVSLRSAALRDALELQGGLYTLATLDRSESFEVIGALREVLVAQQDPATALQRVATPQARLLSLTVTEKGYCLDVDGQLDLSHVDIRHDLQNPRTPCSAVGFLVAGLRLRRAARLPAIPVLSCDNLAGNGRLLAAAAVRFAAELDAGLAAWIAAEVPFPCTMVDSITPATTAALRERVAGVLGVDDAWPVQREAFTQWVVEEHRALESPDWPSAGVIITDDVSGYEAAKLRLLNGAHSTLAYAGLLRGHRTVAEAMQDAPLLQLVRDLMQEDVARTLRPVRGLDVPAYVDSVLQRFGNPAIRHELAQIAWDGSKKLPVRILGTIRDALSRGWPVDRPAVALAAWMHFVRQRVASGEVLVDPLAKPLEAVARVRATGDPSTDVGAFLELAAVFPRDLAASVPLRAAIIRAYAALGAGGSLPVT